MKKKVLQRLYSALPLIVVCMCLAGNGFSVAYADPVIFLFEAEYTGTPGMAHPFSTGQLVSGSYTFELNTPAGTTYPGNTYTRYPDAITDFTVTIHGFGTGNGSGGDILLGNPVQTTGSYNYLSDQYVVQASTVTGIAISSSLYGNRNLLSASIHLQDLDQEGLDSEDLSDTPPDLVPFLDNSTQPYPADEADLWLTFDTSSGGRSSLTFQLTSLTAQVPEPGTPLMMLLVAFGLLVCRRNGHRIYRR